MQNLPVAPLLNCPSRADNIISLVRDLQAFSCHVNERNLNPKLTEILNKEGIVLLAYTVNNEDRMRELVEWGVSGIFTDDPGRMRN